MGVLTPDEVALREPHVAIGERARALPARLLVATRRRLFFLMIVVLPTAAATTYYGLLASDAYVSESRFVIRSAQRPSSGGGIGALLQGTGLPGFQRSVDDAYAVQDFILSRDALRQLDNALGLSALFSDPRIDASAAFLQYSISTTVSRGCTATTKSRSRYISTQRPALRRCAPELSTLITRCR